jgi:hypothetical protein
MDRRWFKRRLEALVDAAVLFVALKLIAPFALPWVASLAFGLTLDPVLAGPFLLIAGALFVLRGNKKTIHEW